MDDLRALRFVLQRMDELDDVMRAKAGGGSTDGAGAGAGAGGGGPFFTFTHRHTFKAAPSTRLCVFNRIAARKKHVLT